MKKWLSLGLVCAMCASLVSPVYADDAKDYKVAMICDSSINDGGWGAACYNAMVAACEKNGWTYEVTDGIGQDEYYDSIAAFCALGYDMIYAPGNQYTDAVLQAAEEYPDIAFALLNGGEGTPAEAVNGNVTSLLPNAQQIGWIAGALAGLMTESGTIAFIGGMELDTTKGKYAGFSEAARSMDVNEAVAGGAKLAGSFVGNDETGYSYIIGSASMDLRTLAAEMKTALQARGGGKPEMIQGQVVASEGSLKSFFLRAR